MKKIELKNYIILCLILIVSVFISIVTMNLIKNYNKSDVANEFKNKINFSELEIYLLENPDFIIYLADNNFDNSIFERKFKKFIVDNDLGNLLVRIDINSVKENEFLSFISKYSQGQINIELTNCVIVIDNQHISSIIAITPGLNDLKNLKKEFKEKGVL